MFGNLALPRLLGAADTALPALGAVAWLLYLLGTVVTLPAALAGGLAGGWDFYAVFRAGAEPGLTETLLTLGVALTAASMVGNGVNIMLTIHRRPVSADGAGLPVFARTLYATAVVHILAALALVVGVAVISTGTKFGTGAADPDLPLRWFWMFAHPFVYASVLPAVGVISETLVRFAGRRAFAPRATAVAIVLHAALVCLTWGRHLFGNGDAVGATVQSGLSVLLIVPAALYVVSWLGTLYGGSIRYGAALWYALGAIVMLAVAVLGSLLLSTPGTAAMLGGTLFASAQFHYLAGGVLLAFLAGLHMWWPDLIGRRYDEQLGQIGALLVFVGCNAAFAPRMLMGLRGARQGWSGPAGDLGVLSVIGGWVLLLGLGVLTVCLLSAYRDGARIETSTPD